VCAPQGSEAPATGCTWAVNPAVGGSDQHRVTRRGMVALTHFQIAISWVFRASVHQSLSVPFDSAERLREVTSRSLWGSGSGT
jgi:hypothetical protein